MSPTDDKSPVRRLTHAEWLAEGTAGNRGRLMGWCWHRWSPWGPPRTMKVTLFGRWKMSWQVQRRTCGKCGKVSERDV